MTFSKNDAPLLIVMGQSNAHAHATRLPEDEIIRTPLKNVHGLSREFNQFYDLTDVTWSGFTTGGMNLGENQDDTCCLANVFAAKWQKAINEGADLPDLYVVQISVGGQGIAEFEVHGWNMWYSMRAPKLKPGVFGVCDISLYPLATDILSLAVMNLIAAGKKPRIIGLHWNQWETEADTGSKALNDAEANNELRMLEVKEQTEIERILAELSAACGNIETSLALNYRNITELAFIFAKSELSFRMDGAQARITGDRRVSLIRARHPLLDAEKVVPITVTLGGKNGIIVITGPNTGGKTVTMKTIGLFALMAQSGLHIPASETSEMCVFDDIFADIGDEQSIEQSLSTFSSHMVNIVGITENMTNRSLVLIDELGAGTDPVEGAALAISVLEKVHSVGALCAATTHYAELKAFALETDGFINASCEFDVNTPHLGRCRSRREKR